MNSSPLVADSFGSAEDTSYLGRSPPRMDHVTHGRKNGERVRPTSIGFAMSSQNLAPESDDEAKEVPNRSREIAPIPRWKRTS